MKFLDKLGNYPRPQLYREGYTSLNGKWDFAYDKENIGESKGYSNGIPAKHKINVPYACETKASGIGKEEPCSVVWYSRTFEVPASVSGKRTILHFEGSDYVTRVWVGGKFVGENRGGYHRFSFDITDVVTTGSNNIVVRCYDSLDARQPRGKQRWYNGGAWGCFYTQSTGIWKEVWLEHIDAAHIKGVKITPDIDSHSAKFEFDLSAEAVGCQLETQILFGDTVVAKVTTEVMRPNFGISLSLNSSADNWQVAEWTLHDPKLYGVRLAVIKGKKAVDNVDSYFGFREFRVQGNKILLNRVPIYQRLILDQGYHVEGDLTPNSTDDFRRDLELIKSMGYNGVRMHQKIEDERYLYWADRLGMIVWVEMPSPYEFDDTMMTDFSHQWINVVKQNYNHPCVCVWVPFNESWGVQRILTDKAQQRFTESMYYLTKAYDTMRPVVSNDGWEHTKSDIITLHNYEECGKRMAEQYAKLTERTLAGCNPTHSQKQPYAEGYGYEGQPIMVSEYGGISFRTKKAEEWGYGKQVEGEKEFLDRFYSVTKAIKDLPGVCGFCYTQFTDVHQETNGLFGPDRVAKLDVDKIKKINLE